MGRRGGGLHSRYTVVYSQVWLEILAIILRDPKEEGPTV